MASCTTCHGAGALIVLTPKTFAAPPRHEVQKCDSCSRFKDDRSAWRKLQPTNRRGRHA